MLQSDLILEGPAPVASDANLFDILKGNRMMTVINTRYIHGMYKFMCLCTWNTKAKSCFGQGLNPDGMWCAYHQDPAQGLPGTVGRLSTHLLPSSSSGQSLQGT